MLFNVE